MCPFSDKREILKEINKNGVYAFNTNLLGSKRGFIYNVLDIMEIGRKDIS